MQMLFPATLDDEWQELGCGSPGCCYCGNAPGPLPSDLIAHLVAEHDSTPEEAKVHVQGVFAVRKTEILRVLNLGHKRQRMREAKHGKEAS